MPHRRHRVRVHVHNRYVKTQLPQQTNRCKKRCKNGSRCRSRGQRGDDDPYRSEDDCDRPIGLGAGRDGQLKQRGCQRFHSAEEVCRPCGETVRGERGRRDDDRRHGAAKDDRHGGYQSDRGGGPCNRCGKNSTGAGGCGCKRGGSGGGSGCGKRNGGGSRPGTPCQRFKSAEETCRSCPRPPGQRQQYGEYQPHQDANQRQQYEPYQGAGQRQQDQYGYQGAGRSGPRAGPCTNYSVYTAHVQQLGFAAETVVPRQPAETPPLQQRAETRPPGKPTNDCPEDPAEITEEIIHTREHRWHIPSSALRPARLDGGAPGSPGSGRRGGDPCVPPPSGGRRRGPGSADGSHRSRRTPVPVGESSSDGGRRVRPASVAGVRRTRSELLAGREMVARIARQVELEDGTRAEHQLVYRLSAQYGAQFGDSASDSGCSDSGVSRSERQRSALSEPDTERTSRTARTVVLLERLRLSDSSGTHSSSDGAAHSPQPAPRSARPAEPPSPLPRRQVTSEPILPAPTAPPPAPATRTTRSLDCQPVADGGGAGRTKKLRTRGALTKLRQRSVTRLNVERRLQLLTEQLVPQTDRLTTGKPLPDGPPHAADSGRRDVTVLHAQNLLPADYQGTGSRGDAAGATEPLYQNPDTLYDSTALKPAGGPGYSGGEFVSPSPYLSRAEDPYQPATSQFGNYDQSPYLETAPAGRSARARFEDDDELGAALYDQRYQPRRDSSPYLSRPTGRAAAAPGTDISAAAAPGTDIRAGAGAAAPTQTGGRLQRQGGAGRQQLGGRGRGVGFGQRLTSSFSSLRQRGAALYRRLSGGRGQGVGGRGRGTGRGRAPLARPGGAAGGGARQRRAGGTGDCSCTDSDSDCGAVNCSFLFYFNGDGGPSPFMSNMPPAITGAGSSQRATGGAMSKKYCNMCD